ncbi:uncharacterized protein TM35_000391840 [Trypanosoma theileri]|uniref:Uncharacterized protein n=1 Tax=Trypanosoma theileri TaxID=67003 RepID=A0A1X0NLL3_9TRYP|nr:uncharacterized protein TM35_000391840 [Trypanosoma theileri]ORC85010.1 hypothetical protein TM35_000391840 [Trypanosoma theileri]
MVGVMDTISDGKENTPEEAKRNEEEKEEVLCTSISLDTSPQKDITQHLYTAVHDGVFGSTFDLLHDVQIEQETTLQAITKVKSELSEREAEMQEINKVFEKMQLYVHKLGIMRNNMEILDANMAKTKRMVEGIRERLQKTSEWGPE